MKTTFCSARYITIHISTVAWALLCRALYNIQNLTSHVCLVLRDDLQCKSFHRDYISTDLSQFCWIILCVNKVLRFKTELTGRLNAELKWLQIFPSSIIVGTLWCVTQLQSSLNHKSTINAELSTVQNTLLGEPSFIQAFCWSFFNPILNLRNFTGATAATYIF